MPAGVSAYTPLANITLSTTASSVTFSSISGAYRDLVLIASPVDYSGFATANLRINGDTGTNYPWVRMQGDGSSATSSSGTASSIASGAYVVSSTERMVARFEFLDYSATDKHKAVLTRGDNGSYLTVAYAQRWANTAAITSIELFSSFGIGSTFALYGVSA
jgi:hypothetical protein